MDLIDENNLTKNQKNLLDLKIRLIKAEDFCWFLCFIDGS